MSTNFLKLIDKLEHFVKFKVIIPITYFLNYKYRTTRHRRGAHWLFLHPQDYLAIFNIHSFPPP